MELIDKYNDKGINKHTIWIFKEKDREIGINHNHDVLGYNYYIFDNNRCGENCGTIWYPTLKIAKLEVKRLFKTGEKVKTGRDFKKCKYCKAHYSFGTKEWNESKDFVCKNLKKQYVRNVMIKLYNSEGCPKLKWTKEMEKVRSQLINSEKNKETWNDDVKKILDYKGFTFFLNIPVCVAGWSSEFSSYKVLTYSDELIQEILPRGYKLIAWYGWGGNGWVAQTKKETDNI